MAIPETLRRRVFALGTWLLGITFGVAAILKASSLSSFAAQVARYALVPPHLAGPTAVGVILVEAALGTCALLGLQVRRAVWGMLFLVSLFTGATLLRWNSLEGTDCNCFGRLSGGGPLSIIVQDALLASVAVLALAVGRGLPPTIPRRRWLRASLGLAAIAAVLVTQPLLAEGSLDEGSSKGIQIRVFLFAGCKHCKASLGRVQEIATTPSLTQAKVFIGAYNEAQIADFLKGTNQSIKYVPLTIHQLGEFVPSVPTVQLVRDGEVRHEWLAQVPSIGEISSAIGALPPRVEKH